MTRECSRCGAEILGSPLKVEYVGLDGLRQVLSLCRGCFDEFLGFFRGGVP